MRGLKHGNADADDKPLQVASFVDAWIETPKLPTLLMIYTVASFVDAWIETCWLPDLYGRIGVASFVDAWIETWDCCLTLNLVMCRILRGYVDWNPKCKGYASLDRGRILRGYVDWNNREVARVRAEMESHPSWMRGLKPPFCVTNCFTYSRILRGCVDWNSWWLG